MKKMLLFILVLIVMLGTGFRFLGFGDKKKNVVDLQTERQTKSGKVIGFKENNNSHAWLGIPYAKAPINKLRWKEPRPAQKWEGTRKALEYGPFCTQIADMSVKDSVSKKQFGQAVGSEDCLYLNVWAPEFTQDNIPKGENRLPVMVWIHGGGNSVGHGGGMYNGKILSEIHNLILVTFNYRLGPLGWFTHPALRENNATPEDQSGNFGTLDIIHVLSWVQENIEYFGGDKDNVTVFGESAGGVNTFAMLLSPVAKGLFHKAIVQSGAIRSSTMALGENFKDANRPGHPASSREIINRLLIADHIVDNREAAKTHQKKMTNPEIRDYLYNKSNLDIFNACNTRSHGMGMISFPYNFQDGVVLPMGKPVELFENTSNYNSVPIIMGTNRDEFKLFMVINPEYVNRYLGFYIRMKDKKLYNLVARYRSDGWKAYGTDENAAVLTQSQGSNVYVYRFDWDEEPSILGMDMSFLLGSAHLIEVPFVFGIFNTGTLMDVVFTKNNFPERKALSDSMMSYWAEFAYTSSPGKGRNRKQVRWKPWNNSSPESHKYIILDTQQDRGIRMASGSITLSNLKQKLVAETGFTSQEKHCETYANLFMRSHLWDDEEYKNLGKEGCKDYPKETFIR